MGSSYFDLLTLVQEYYGTGSDQWLRIANGTASPQEFTNILRQTPGVDIVVNGKGEVINYSLNQYAQPLLHNNIGGEANSNTLVPQYGKGSQISTKIPAETSLTQTGKVTATSGIRSAGKFVTSEVIPAIAAAGVGITLGKTIDSVLYNAAPDFWDEHGMYSLNPETWSVITAGDSSVQSRLFNMLFQIDEQAQSVQPYISTDAFAYLSLYMQQQGLFNKAGFNPGTALTNGTITYNNPSNSYSYTAARFNENINVWKGGLAFNPLIEASHNSGGNTWSPIIGVSEYILGQVYPIISSYLFGIDNFTGYIIVLLSEEVYNACPRAKCFHTADGGYFSWSSSSTYTHRYTITENGETHTFYGIHYSGFISYPYYSINNMNIISTSFDKFAYFMRAIFLGTASIPLDGVGTQTISDGQGGTMPAKTPELTNDMTIQDVLDALRIQYPELFDDSVTQDVVQPDGGTKEIVYIPIGFPDIISLTDTQPTITDQTQEDTSVSPQTDPEQRLEDITTAISDIDEVPPPETGEGETPPFVPPVGSATALWSIYNPTEAEVQAFGAWLWSPNFVDQLLKMFNDPMQSIISLHKVFASPSISGRNSIKVGYLDSQVVSNVVNSQYVTVNCGSVDLHEFFGNALDYSPFTSIRLYLPFIGIVDIDEADVVRSTITVTYKVDVFTGVCLAEVSIQRDAAGGVLYTYNGKASVEYPLSSGNYMGLVTGAAGAIASAFMKYPGGVVSSIANARSRVSHSGELSGNAGAMGIKKPYFIIQRPQKAMSSDFNVYDGIPSNYSVRISDCSGYIKVKSLHTEGMSATNEEKYEIERLLKQGIIV